MPRKLNARECADELGLSVELVRDYMMRGCPHTKGGRGRPNKLDADEVAAWMKAEGLTGNPGRPTEESPDIEAAKLREINLRCRKHELDVAEREHQLLPTEEVKQFVGEAISVFRNNWAGFAAGVVPQLQGRDAAEQQGILEKRSEEFFTSLGKTLTDRFGCKQVA